MKITKHPRAWVVTVDMGYGHQRAVYPLRHLAYKNIITANNYRGIPLEDKSIWEKSERFYEAVSRFKRIPVIGEMVFNLYDHFQAIAPLYPKRDLSKPTLPVIEMDHMIRKGWGKHLIDKLRKRSTLPIVTSFFITALMADIHGYPGPIYCIICDADFSRSWVSEDPKKSRIQYFASNYRVVERLKLYGVPDERIFLTGFPLPKENIGNGQLVEIKKDLLNRLPNLDPQRRYIRQYHETIREQLDGAAPKRSPHKLTLMFAVGGAGAQADVAGVILRSLGTYLKRKQLEIVLVAGVREDVKQTFLKAISDLQLKQCYKRNIHIVYEATKNAYFESFNHHLRSIDVLWTKPSELCFYTALGVPLIMAPAIGSQEKFNKLWLKSLGAGITQQDPQYTNEWFFDWLESGCLAEAAMQGFLEAPRYGTYNIETILAQHPEKVKEVRTVLQY